MHRAGQAPYATCPAGPPGGTSDTGRQPGPGSKFGQRSAIKTATLSMHDDNDGRIRLTTITAMASCHGLLQGAWVSDNMSAADNTLL